jgi:hypothetical protein
MGLSLAGCIIFVILYTRFIQVQKNLNARNLKNCSLSFHKFLNYVSVLVGSLVCLALITVANFQVRLIALLWSSFLSHGC